MASFVAKQCECNKDVIFWKRGLAMTMTSRVTKILVLGVCLKKRGLKLRRDLPGDFTELLCKGSISET